jgi:FAD/FMN-containing dehydrogenase
METLPGSLTGSLAGIVGAEHVLTGDAAAGYAVDWTGRFRGQAAAVVRPRDTAAVAAVLALCRDAGVPVVPQGGNTGLVGGGVPLHGEVVLSLARLSDLEPADQEASQVTAGAGVTLQRVADADPDLDLGIQIASRESATVGGAVATNAGGVRVLRYGPMRAQLRGIEAVLSDGTVVSHLAGLTKDNTGYDYPSLLAGSEGTLAVITRARLRLVPRIRDAVTAVIGVDGLAAVHALARQAVASVPGLISAEFFTSAGLDVLIAHAGLVPPLPAAPPAYLLLDATGPGALDDLAEVIGDLPAAVGESAADRRRLWYYRERHPEAAGFLGVPIKLDVSVPAAHWVRLASEVAAVVGAADPGARVITFGHVADGNVHVNIVPGAAADGRHEDAVFNFVASLGGSISAEHGIGALKAPWLHLARTEAERGLFARIRGALDPSGTLNPHVLPRLGRGRRQGADVNELPDARPGALAAGGIPGRRTPLSVAYGFTPTPHRLVAFSGDRSVVCAGRQSWFRGEPDRTDEEVPGDERQPLRVQVGGHQLLRDGTVGRVVVLAAEEVVVDPRDARAGDVDAIRHRRFQAASHSAKR